MQQNNTNTHFYQSLLFVRNMEFPQDFDHAMEGLESEVLKK